MKKIILIVLAFLPIAAFSQSKVVTGKVVDVDGQPLPGVNILIKGSSTGTITDMNGSYNIEVDPNGTLVFSFIGMTTEEVQVQNRSTININMAPDIKALEEIVVIGYGEQSLREVTGSISTVKAKDLENIPVASTNLLLQGRAAGVQVTQNSGSPGGGVSVRIRGTTSISASNEPLYVVDGVPVKSEDVSGLGDVGNSSAIGSLNPLSDINANDIESIQVLKDASSAAIYGARAANGVIIITTKRGKSGKPSINLNYYTGISEITRRIPVLNARQYREFLTEADLNDNRIPGSYLIDSLNPYHSGDVFWQDVLFTKAPVSNYDFSVRGGKEGATYAASAGYLNQDGVVYGTEFNRFTASLNSDYVITPKLTFGESIKYSKSYTNRTSQGESKRSTINYALVKAPLFPIYALDGSYIGKDQQDRGNPIAIAELATQDANSDRLIANVYGEYEITKGLFFKTSAQLDYLTLKEDVFYPSSIDPSFSDNRRAMSRTAIDKDWITEYTLRYEKTINDKHVLSAVTGYIIQENKSDVINIVAEGAPTDNIYTTNASTRYIDASTRISKWGIASYIGRINYSYADKYLLQMNVRRDASSRFGADKKVGVFPSASLGWRVSGEDFMKSLSLVEDLKFRASYGSVGNQSIGNYIAHGLYVLGENYLGSGGITPAGNGIANPQLSWESTSQFDAGLDLSLFRGRITFTADYYIKTTKDLLLQVDLPRNTGFEKSIQNVGSIENRGTEFNLATENIHTSSFKWSTNFNIAFNRSKVLKLNSGETELAVAGLSQSLTRVGLPVGTFYGWNSLGIYARDEDNTTGLQNSNGNVFRGGDMIWEDVDGNNIIDDKDRTIIGDPNPDFIGGINNTFSFNRFELSVFNQFSYGNDIYNAMRRNQNGVFGANNPTTDALKRWKQQGDITDFPRIQRGDARVQNGRHSDRWVEDGSYFRVKTVTLAYNIPADLLSKVKIQRCRIYATGQNLFTITNYKGLDPEVNSYGGALSFGIDNGAYPQSRTFIFGANIGF